MSFYERFEELCNEVGIRPQSDEMQAITGVSSPAISGWKLKNALPKGDVLCRLSQYFHVTTDYLLGLTEVRQPQAVPVLTEQELLLLEAYRAATAAGQFHIIQVCMNERDAAVKGESENAG